MCLNPSKVPNIGFVACRNCWQCRETKIDDWVGRNIAESKTAVAAHVVTLTYGRDLTTGDVDNIRAALLTYSDVQKYLKYLRADGYPVRYFVVGESGSLKGRAHWHIILYWQGEVPDHKIKENFMEKHWPHGWSYWDKASAEAVRYACKYILKDVSDPDKQSWGPMPSKKPPLGDDYFRQLAQRYVDQGLAPQHLFYSFPDVKRVAHGFRGKTVKAFREAAKPVRFRMHGKTAENFLSYFIDAWHEKYATPPPKSALLDAFSGGKLAKDDGFEMYLEAHGIQRETLDSDQYARHLAAYADRFGFKPVSAIRGTVLKPTRPPFEGAKVQFCEKANCYYTDSSGSRLWFSIDSEGDAVWHAKIRPDYAKPARMRISAQQALSQKLRSRRGQPEAPRGSYREASKGA